MNTVMTNAEFAKKCAYVAQMSAEWAVNSLQSWGESSKPHDHDHPIAAKRVREFLSEIREFLDEIEARIDARPLEEMKPVEGTLK